MSRMRAGRNVSAWVTLASMGALALVVPGAGRAGDGTIVGKEVNLTVYFGYAVTSSELDEWKATFQRASTLLYQATNGNCYFGKITITTCPDSKDGADIRISPKTVDDRANASARGIRAAVADPDVDVRDRRVQLFFRDRNAPEVLFHELGHYLFGCFDEYSGLKEYKDADGEWQFMRWKLVNGERTPTTDDDPLGRTDWEHNGNPDTSPWYCIARGANDRTTATNSSNACVMDGYRDGVNTWRKNFCLKSPPSNAHTGQWTDGNGIRYSTGQWMDIRTINEHRSSPGLHACWDEVAAVLGITPPSDYPNNTGSAPAVNFEITQGHVFFLCLDRSGSTRPQDTDSSGSISQAETDAASFARVQRAGIVTVALAKARKTPTEGPAIEGDFLGLISFNHKPTVDMPLTEIVPPGVGPAPDPKTLAIFTIMALSPAGGTNIRGALNEALTKILEHEILVLPAGQRFCSRAVILVTDAEISWGGTVDDALIQGLAASKVKVYLVLPRHFGGPWADVQWAAGLIVKTGGAATVFPADQGGAAAIRRILTHARGDQQAASASGSTTPGTTSPASMVIDSHATEATFTLVGSSETSPLGLGLTDPSGTALSLAPPPAGVTVDSSNGVTVIRIESPAAGTWTATVDATSTTSAQTYDLGLSTLTASLSVGGGSAQAAYTYPEPVVVSVSVDADGRVGGCQVTALVTRPDGTTATTELLDDGDVEVHGDQLMADGIYSNLYADFTGDGTYVFDITVTNVAGFQTGAGFSDQYEGPPITGAAVAPFTRTVTYGALVGGVPSGGGRALLPPDALSISSAAGGLVTLGWTDTNAGTAGHVVQRRATAGDFADVATIAAGTASYADTGLATGDYQWQVLADRSGARSSPSNIVSATAGGGAGGSGTDGSDGSSGGGGTSPCAAGAATTGGTAILALVLLAFLSRRRLGKAKVMLGLGLAFSLPWIADARQAGPSDAGTATSPTIDYPARLTGATENNVRVEFRCSWFTAALGATGRQLDITVGGQTFTETFEILTTQSTLSACGGGANWHSHTLYIYNFLIAKGLTTAAGTVRLGFRADLSAGSSGYIDWHIDSFIVREEVYDVSSATLTANNTLFQDNFDGAATGWTIANTLTDRGWAIDSSSSLAATPPYPSAPNTLNYHQRSITVPGPAPTMDILYLSEIVTMETTTITIVGTNFTSGTSTVTSVTLEKAGQTAIAGDSISVTSADYMTVAFTVPWGTAAGAWDLVVTRSDTASRRRKDAVEVFAP